MIVRLGVEWMWEQGTTLDDKPYQQEGTTDFGLTDEIFGLKYGILSSKLDTMLHALTKDTKVNILSTPRVMTKNNQEAIINVGQAVPFLVSTQETATGGILTSTDFRDVGVILTVTPRSTDPEPFPSMSINRLIVWSNLRCLMPQSYPHARHRRS